eukprot:4351465-Amphidinium_carterae.1
MVCYKGFGTASQVLPDVDSGFACKHVECLKEMLKQKRDEFVKDAGEKPLLCSVIVDATFTVCAVASTVKDGNNVVLRRGKTAFELLMQR